MKMLVLVLNKKKYLEDILKELNNAGIKGATIIDSAGMAKVLHSNHTDTPVFGSLKLMLNENRPFNKTIFTILKDSQVDLSINIIKNILGDLNKPNVGILFTVPVNHIEGLNL